MAKEKARKYFKSFAMIVARTYSLASIVKYRGAYLAGGGICGRILTGLPLELNFDREGFARRIDYFLSEEQTLVNVEDVKKQPDGSDYHALDAGLKPRATWEG